MSKKTQETYLKLQRVIILSILTIIITMAIVPNIAIASPENLHEEHKVALYDFWEYSDTRKIPPFEPFDMDKILLLAEIYAPDGRQFEVEGFFDGENDDGHGIWRLRFMPDLVGRWCASIRWNPDEFPQKTKCFSVSENPNTLIHGHVRRYLKNSIRLVHDDGTPHYWIGGKWFSPKDYAPCDKDAFALACLSDEQIIDYLNLLKEHSHNGILLKIAQFPLMDDGISWNLALLSRAEWLTEEARQRGIYVQLSFFDTWSRQKGEPYEVSTDGKQQVLNVWADTQMKEKRNYLRYITARFSAFSNIYWELGNEMEHHPNCGECFVALANDYYIPWLRAADPYDLPIGLSENIWQATNVDIGFLHQANRLPASFWKRPTIMNELVRGGSRISKTTLFLSGPWEWLAAFRNGLPRPPLWKDTTMRDSWHRYDYRTAFWSMFIYGGSGTSEATWLSLYEPLNENVINVMRDHGQLASFIDSLGAKLLELKPVQPILRIDNQLYPTLSDGSGFYIVYLNFGRNKKPSNSSNHSAHVKVPAGSYTYSWLYCDTGQESQDKKHISKGEDRIISYEQDHKEQILIMRLRTKSDQEE